MLPTIRSFLKVHACPSGRPVPSLPSLPPSALLPHPTLLPPHSPPSRRQLYPTIGIPKLAALLEVDEASFREHLQCLKHKAHGISWTAGAPISGEWASSAEIDFFVDGTMAHVADFSRTRRHSEFFVKQINKLEEIVSNLKT